MSGRWHTAIGLALTGAELDLPESGSPDVAALIHDLAGLGWPAHRIAEHAREEVSAERPWPHPVGTAVRAGCGPAQFAAALTAARVQLGLVTLETRAPSARRTLTADEQRLLREVPPHHGH